MSERFEFQTEARQLLDLMIHSVYSNKDIFLRELVSNSSDALDKLRIESLRDDNLRDLMRDPHIRIQPDKEAHTLTISDNGIGMDREELIRNIGTIARSGTKEFVAMMKSRADGEASVPADLIGQFGVGFYSTFMVADRVTLVTRKAGESQAWRWESTGDGSYTLEEAERDTHGTTVTLHLKPVDRENALNDYTDEWTIRGIVKRYSDFVTYPVRMRTARPAGDKEKEEGSGAIIDEKGMVVTDDTLNSMKAIWTRPAGEASQQELNEFYKHISHDWSDPLTSIHFRAEGTFEYYTLLFIPSRAPFDIFMREGERGLHLYVKRVFILDDAKDLLPLYLRFVKGVVDSEDLPLNISREILQQNRQIQLIRKRITKKTLDTLGEMKEKESEKYLTFWRELGAVLKEGIFQDQENMQQILDLAYFRSTASEELISLKDYIGRMKEGEESIYFISGDDRSVLENSPHMEAFREKGYEVLFLTDPVDQIWTTSAVDFQGKKFHSVMRGDIDLGSQEEKAREEEERKEKALEYGALLTTIRQRLDENVKEVRLSNRLRSSAVCLVADESDMSPQVEKILRSMGQETPKSKRIMELNAGHPVVARMHDILNNDPVDPRLADYIDLLYGQALIAEGGQLPDPGRFSRLVADLMVRG